MGLRVRLALGLAGLLAAAVAAVLILSGDEEEPRPRGGPVPAKPLPPRPAAPLRPPFSAHVNRRTQLRATPGGRVIGTLGTRTGFGSFRVLAVVGRSHGWLAVLTHHRGNGRAAWIPARSALLLHVPYTLTADLSDRVLTVRREGRVVRRVRVAVGRPGHETPTGRFAVTDRLYVRGSGSPYGCCAIALSGRQPNVPQGWGGGDRIAIHGTPSTGSIGTPASNGCLRAGERDMRWLMRSLPLGTRVTIRA